MRRARVPAARNQHPTPAAHVGFARRLIAFFCKVAAVGTIVLNMSSAPATTPDETSPLHDRIDAAIEYSHTGPLSPLTDDADFLRRLYLDLTGMIPPATATRQFLDDTDPNKRAQLIDRLLSSPQHVRHMQIVFDLMFMERRADKEIKSDEWRRYLYDSFRANKPYNQLAREVLRADAPDLPARPATKFYLDRNGAVNILTRDVGRIFFGVDLQCAQCHDHPAVEDYLQSDYYGLYAFLSRSYVTGDRRSGQTMVGEKAAGEVEFKSVFTEVQDNTAPRLPGGIDLLDPKFHNDQYKVRPAQEVAAIPSYSRRGRLALEATSGENAAFNRNIVNRLWALMMGRGLVHPLDLHHSDNPPTHPALIELLAAEFASSGYDTIALLAQIARSRSYQRSSRMPTIDLEPLQAQQLIAAREDQVIEQKSALKAARTSWGIAKAKLEEARDALDLTDYPDASRHEILARDRAYEAVFELTQLQKEVADRTTALHALHDLVKLAKAAAQELPDGEDLRTTAQQVQERAEQLVDEIEKARERLPSAEARVPTTAEQMSNAYDQLVMAEAKAHPLVERVLRLEAGVDANRRQFVREQNRLRELHYAQKNAQLLLHYLQARAKRAGLNDAVEGSNRTQATAAELQKELADGWRRRFAVASLKPLSPEQLSWSALRAVGLVDARLDHEQTSRKNEDPIEARFAAERVAHNDLRDTLKSFLRLYGQRGQEQQEFQATPQQALYLMNSAEVNDLLKPSAGNLTARLLQADNGVSLAEELYLSVLSRRPTRQETEAVSAYLRTTLALAASDSGNHSNAQSPARSESTRTINRRLLVQELVSALLTSTEFRFNR